MSWEKVHNGGKKIQDTKQIRELLDTSAKKNNNLLIFFFTFGLYILISTLGTTDIALLLPKQGFKMPLIDFELDLLNFFVLGPLLLLLLHFNLLFSHHKHLEKLNTYKNKVNINSIDPSLYSFAFIMGNHGFSGRMINIMLWILLYFLPLLIFLIIYIRFADYHHEYITPLHLGIIILDLIFIISSIIYNDIFYKSRHSDHSPIKINTISKYIVYIFIISIGFLTILYYSVFFAPIVRKDYDPSYLKKIKNDCLPKLICYPISLISEHKKYCYPRLIVTEEEMAKISKSALYIPRHLVMGEIKEYKNMKDTEKEKKLILDYGTRIDLTDRNLRYADLKSSILTRAAMTNSLFDAADLRQSHMQAVDLTGASFIDADLKEAKLQSAVLEKTNLLRASLHQANMNDADVIDCNFKDALMQKAQLRKVKFTNDMNQKGGDANLRHADLSSTDLTDAELLGIDLTGASLQNANITGTVFDNANLTAVDLSDVYFHITLDKMNDNYFLQGLPSFKETKMFGVNISKYKKPDNNSSKKQNTILFDVNISKKFPDPFNTNISIYPVLFEANTSQKYPILPDNPISKKFPDLFDANISKKYTIIVDANVSEKYPFLVNVNISDKNNTFYIIYTKRINSQEGRKKLENILQTPHFENFKNKGCNTSKSNTDKYLNIICHFIDKYLNKR